MVQTLVEVELNLNIICCTHYTLDEDDLCDILEEVESVKLTFFPLGRCLRLACDDLKPICEACTDQSTADKALNDVVLLWLHQKYNVGRFGLPTWRMLVEAVDKKTGGNNHELAKQIALSHPSGTSPLVILLLLTISACTLD